VPRMVPLVYFAFVHPVFAQSFSRHGNASETEFDSDSPFQDVVRKGNAGKRREHAAVGGEFLGPVFEGVDPAPPKVQGLFDFGEAHAAVHHVLSKAPFGDFMSVLQALDEFSLSHELDFGTGAMRSMVLNDASQQAVTLKMNKPESDGLTVLVMGAGMGCRTLHSLAPILEADRPDWSHRLVSVDADERLLNGVGTLVAHALADHERVEHVPLRIGGEGAMFPDILKSLRTHMNFPAFDIVSLDASHGQHRQHLRDLVKRKALHKGSIVHVEGLGRENGELEEYLSHLETGKQRFTSEVHQLDESSSAVVSTLHSEL